MASICTDRSCFSTFSSRSFSSDNEDVFYLSPKKVQDISKTELEVCDFQTCGQFIQIPAEDKLKDRLGSWSDSGYSYSKSDSDYSCFSSLSFGESVPQSYRDTGVYCEEISQDHDDFWQTEIKREIEKLSENLSEACLHHRNSSDCIEVYSEENKENTMFEEENFSSEEIKILHEIVNNPENKYETTQALSDICRDVPSKRNRSTPKKFKKAFKLLCKKISEPLKGARKNDAQRKGKQNLPDLSKRAMKTVSEKTDRHSPKDSRKLSLFKSPTKNIQRASSYSSLFGRKGSLFAYTEAGENSIDRSVSLFSLECKELLNDELYNLESNKKSVYITISCEKIRNQQWSTCKTAEDNVMCSSQSESRKASFNQSNCSEISSCHSSLNTLEYFKKRCGFNKTETLIAPLQKKVSERRSSQVRQIRKISDII